MKHWDFETDDVKSESMQPIILYGVPFSQPVRAVMWLMLYKRMPFEMVLINPGSKGETGSRNPNYLAKNPGGTIPTIEEPDTGFVLAEAHAIMCYLCNTHRWDDVYPTDFRARAKVDWYLNYHHRNVRDASVGLVAPRIRKDLNIPEATQQAARATLTNALHVLEQGWLENSRFLAGAEPTIAGRTGITTRLPPGSTRTHMPASVSPPAHRATTHAPSPDRTARRSSVSRPWRLDFSL